MDYIMLITLGAHAQRGYGSWVVCQFVCLSGLYLAGRAFIRSTNDATYLAGNEVENFVRFCLKRLRCRAGVLPVLYRGGHFSSARYALASRSHAFSGEEKLLTCSRCSYSCKPIRLQDLKNVTLCA